eukprot:TRINITY_DN3718_c0_g1_i2.p1 TRINITY_DN3718_c0_g1~~TRINITY_DN3718_c0_g1_i2.p1  ORF type:complete len:425 (+),score=84.93 TRINITY_DN3718_c0_g1_i2:38-1276(+)
MVTITLSNMPRLAVFLTLCVFYASIHSVVVAQLPAYCGQPPGLLTKNFMNNEPVAPGFTLSQVHTFIRHGDRLPASSGASSAYGSCWPNDEAVWNCTLNYDEIPDTNPNQNSVAVPRLYRKVYDAGRNVYPGNCMMGQLTQQGYAQEIANGQALRANYVENIPLLNPELDLSQVYVRSDDEPRTVQSAHALMLGLFPPSNDADVAQIVNLHTMDYQVDDTSVNPALCPRLLEVWNESFSTPAYIEHTINVTIPLINELESVLGYSPVDPSYAFDCVNTHLCHSFPVPEGLTTDLYNRLVAENIYEFSNLLIYPNTTYNSQLNVGFYLANFYNILNGYINGTGNQDVKFYLWSGHDVTLYAIMVAMEFFDNQWPAYASMINFEVWQDVSNNFYIRTLHNGVEVTLPACSGQVC